MIINIVETHEVNSEAEALKVTMGFLEKGLEGSVLKDKTLGFRNCTSNQQLKIKLQIEGTFKITGFTEGTVGTSREQTFGAMMFETDDGLVKGQTSGFTDDELQDFNGRREELIGTYCDIEFNDLSLASGSTTWALSHPRFLGLRPDKTESDTLKRLKETINMARGIS